MSKHLQNIIDYQQHKNNSAGVMQSRTWYQTAADTSPQSNSAALLFQLYKNLDKKKYILYKPAKIYQAGGDLAQTWFVHFSHRANAADKFKRVKITGDINRIPDKETRLQAAKILQRLINDALDNGWVPGEVSAMATTGIYTVTGAIEQQLKIKVKALSKTTGISYSSRVNMFIEWLKANSLDKLPVQEFTTMHADQYTAHMLDKGNNNKTVNGTNETLRGLFTRMVKMKIIRENPYTGIDRLKVADSDWFTPYTNDEIKNIANELREKMPELFCFWAIIYYTYMRPLSIVQFTADNFDFKERLIYVEGKQHKNKRAAVKQLLQPLYEILVQYGYDKIQPGVYFFSTGLRPGKNLITPKRAAGFWKQLIIDGLGINKKLYAAKHTGGSNYLEDNAGTVDLNWLQKQMGHSSLQETETYINKRTVKKLDESKTNLRKL